MTEKITVYTVIITHKHGTNVHVAATREAAEEILAQFAREWWADVAQDDTGLTCAEYEEQHGKTKLIETYFDLENRFGGYETANIEDHELEIER